MSAGHPTDRHPEPGTAICLDCDWTAAGPDRFHAAVSHREETGHEQVPASLRDAEDDDTGARVTAAFQVIDWNLR
jgi:hypothetical protein